MDRLDADRLHLDLYAEAAKRLGYPLRPDPPDDDPDGDTVREDVAAHNARAARWLAQEIADMEFVRAEGIAAALKCLAVAIEAVEAERKALNDRR